MQRVRLRTQSHPTHYTRVPSLRSRRGAVMWGLRSRKRGMQTQRLGLDGGQEGESVDGVAVMKFIATANLSSCTST